MDRGIVFVHSDLYALAATAVVMLTGKQPKQLIDRNSYRWNWQEEVTISPKLEWVLTKMLSYEPSDRFTSATEVIQALKEISALKALTPKSRPVNKQLSTSKNQIFSRLTPKLLFFVLLAGTILLGNFWWWKNRDLAT